MIYVIVNIFVLSFSENDKPSVKLSKKELKKMKKKVSNNII